MLKFFTFRTTKYVEGRYQRYGCEMPNRLLSPHYCWRCYRHDVSVAVMWIVVIVSVIVFAAVIVSQ